MVQAGSLAFDTARSLEKAVALTGILTAEIDLDEIAEGKFDLDVAGHYSRPDVFRLVVNE